MAAHRIPCPSCDHQMVAPYQPAEGLTPNDAGECWSCYVYTLWQLDGAAHRATFFRDTDTCTLCASVDAAEEIVPCRVCGHADCDTHTN